jgi:DNA-binding FadR family transcriptional regulator
MAGQYGVSRDVIRRAKEQLAGEGWLIVLHGRSTFVTPPKIDIDRAIRWVHCRSCDERSLPLWFVGRTRLRSRAGRTPACPS